MLKPSARADIAPFMAMEMARDAARRAAAGQRIIRFDAGLPFVGAPDEALDAVRAALGRDTLGYTDSLGNIALREAISAHYARAYGIDVSPARIAVTTGASGAFTLAFLALFNTGDRVALAAPGYPPYRHILSALGMTPHCIEASDNDRFQLQAHHLREAARTHAIAGALVSSPANPTGTMLLDAELRDLTHAARDIGAAFISDEIYHGLTFERPAVTALTFDPNALIINSFSKYWAMTGWRVGWLIAPEALMGAVERIAQNLTICPPHVSQIAALAALGAGQTCEARKAVYAANRALLMQRLPALGLAPIAPPDGAFYVLADCSAHGEDSHAFCQRALAEAGVALTTGLDFDEARGRRWVRLAYARAHEEVADGVERLARLLGGA